MNLHALLCACVCYFETQRWSIGVIGHRTLLLKKHCDFVLLVNIRTPTPDPPGGFVLRTFPVTGFLLITSQQTTTESVITLFFGRACGAMNRLSPYHPISSILLLDLVDVNCSEIKLCSKIQWISLWIAFRINQVRSWSLWHEPFPRSPQRNEKGSSRCSVVRYLRNARKKT